MLEKITRDKHSSLLRIWSEFFALLMNKRKLLSVIGTSVGDNIQFPYNALNEVIKIYIAT
jgi:hypothetical protein